MRNIIDNLVFRFVDIADIFDKSLVELIKQYKGNTRLEIRLIDKSTGYNLGFFSKKFSIKVCQDLIDAAQRMGMICRVIK